MKKNRSRALWLASFTRLDASKARTRPLAVFDMETADGTLLGPIAGIAFTSDDDYPDVIRFDSMIALLEHFLQKRYRSYIAYAHKGLSFDLAHILGSKRVQDWLLAGGFSVTIDRSYAIIRKAKHAWYFGDSLRLIPEKLEYVLQSFAPHRTKEKLPDAPFSWDHPGWSARIYNDTIGLYESLKQLEQIVHDTFHIPLSLTMPSTALRAARTMLPLAEVRRPPRIALDWIRAGAYSGGRIEVFAQGEIIGNVYCFDINSAYAFAMKSPFPVGEGRYKIGEPRGEFFIGRCTVHVSMDETIPPVLSRLFNHAFCVGDFQAMLTSEEVAFARECGATVNVIECWAWQKREPVFRAFITACERVRRRDYHGPLGKAVKLMQNGLYGILGMNPYRKVQLLSTTPPPLPWMDAFDTRNGVYIANTYEAYLRKESPNQMPHWAAIITARVRIQLTRYLRLCRDVGLTPLYAHTDSIWLTSPNGVPKAVRTLCSDAYGDLKLERRGDRAIIVAPGEAALHTINDPDHPWKISSKGWKATADIFERGEEMRLEQVQTFRAGTALKWRAPGRVIHKTVMNYGAMSNRIPARWRPGPTIPKIAERYDYDGYWGFARWYVGKLLRERPSASAYRLTSEPQFEMIKATARRRRRAESQVGGITDGEGKVEHEVTGATRRRVAVEVARTRTEARDEDGSRDQ